MVLIAIAKTRDLQVLTQCNVATDLCGLIFHLTYLFITYKISYWTKFSQYCFYFTALHI